MISDVGTNVNGAFAPKAKKPEVAEQLSFIKVARCFDYFGYVIFIRSCHDSKSPPGAGYGYVGHRRAGPELGLWITGPEAASANTPLFRPMLLPHGQLEQHSPHKKLIARRAVINAFISGSQLM